MRVQATTAPSAPHHMRCLRVVPGKQCQSLYVLMFWVQAGSNVWYQAYRVRESANEVKFRFPGGWCNCGLDCDGP
jgi:hypothetical protein